LARIDASEAEVNSLPPPCDTLAKANEMLTAAKNAKEAKLDRTAGDVQRSQTEVLSRRAERLDLESRVGAASARLNRLLLLPATVKLIPSEAVIAPVTLIDPTQTLDQLIAVGVSSRPDLAAYREAIGAAQERVRFQKHGPLLTALGQPPRLAQQQIK